MKWLGEYWEEGDSVTVESGEAWQEVRCNNCQGRWQDIYILDRYEAIDMPEENDEENNV